MKRVISLLPSATEIVCALGATELLVGVTHECDYPAAALALPRVTSARIDPSMSSTEIDRLVGEQLEETGSLYALDMDLVRRLEPDLVLTQQLCTVCAVGYATVHAAMRTLSAPPEVVNLEPRTIDEVFASIGHVAALLGIADRGDALVARLRTELAAIEPPPAPPSVLLLEWLEPPFAAGHWMPALVEAAGARPVLHFDGTHSRQVTWDAIEDEPFDVLAISCCGFGVERAMFDVERSQRLAQLAMARPELRVVVLDGNHYFSRPGPRLVESARLLNAALSGISPRDAQASIKDPYRIVTATSLRTIAGVPGHAS